MEIFIAIIIVFALETFLSNMLFVRQQAHSSQAFMGNSLFMKQQACPTPNASSFIKRRAHIAALVREKNYAAVIAMLPQLQEFDASFALATLAPDWNNDACIQTAILSAIAQGKSALERQTAIDIAIAHPSPMAIEAIKNCALADESEEVRLTAAEALDKNADTKAAAKEALFRLTQSQNGIIATAAARLYANHDKDHGVALLMSMLDAEGLSSRLWAARYLGYIGSDVAAKKLASLLQTEQEWDVKKVIAEALKNFPKSPEACQALVTLFRSWEGDCDSDTLHNAVTSLTHFRSEEAISLMADLAKGNLLDGERYRPAAVSSLKNIQRPDIEALLIDIVSNDKDSWLLCSAIESLGYFNSETAIAFLANLIKTRNHAVPAAMALANMATPKAISILIATRYELKRSKKKKSEKNLRGTVKECLAELAIKATQKKAD